MDHARGSRRWGVVRVVWFAAAACAGAQQPGGADAPAALVAEIASRFRCIEACARTLAIRVEVEVRERGGATFDPPRSARVDWRMRGGRTLVHVAGCDLDSVSDQEPAPGAARARLYLPGGITESADAAGSFTRDQRSYLDAGSLTSDLGPSEFLWTFCGTYRSVILAERATRVVGVAGARPDRIVDLEADDSAGTQRITFSCVERWGFLPRACRMFARHRGRWEELRTIEVEEARATRLGFVPERASLTARIPRSRAQPALESFEGFRASYRFGPPELTGISVPHSLAANERGAHPGRPASALRRASP